MANGRTLNATLSVGRNKSKRGKRANPTAGRSTCVHRDEKLLAWTVQRDRDPVGCGSIVGLGRIKGSGISGSERLAAKWSCRHVTGSCTVQSKNRTLHNFFSGYTGRRVIFGTTSSAAPFCHGRHLTNRPECEFSETAVKD
jgi:hypothetical protein